MFRVETRILVPVHLLAFAVIHGLTWSRPLQTIGRMSDWRSALHAGKDDAADEDALEEEEEDDGGNRDHGRRGHH